MRFCLSRACLLTLLLLASPSLTLGQAPKPTPADAPALDAGIPFDPAVTTGTLANGLTYFIRHNGRPANRVSLRLAVKAGSIDETDDQQGLAHVLEHMAFDGTGHFKPGELIAFFESTGARMGPHVNAYTSFDETVYMFEIPTDKEGLVAKGLLALADFAGAMTLDPKQIEKERGVVIEEWRQGLGASSRIRDKQIPVLYHDSKYAERLPIGKPDIIRTFPRERLRDFYRTWYRPDRMAVIVVGDIDPKALAGEVKATFGALKNPTVAAPARHYPVPIEKGRLISVATDPEVTRSSVSLVRKRPRESEARVVDYRRGLVDRLADQIFQERFQELARKPDAPFLNAGAYGSALSRDVATYTTTASVQEGKIEQGLAALAIESKRVRQFGFGAAELDRAKKWTLAAFERAYGERDKSESGSFAQEYLSYFLDAEPSPGIEYEFLMVKRFLPAITDREVSDRARFVLDETSAAVLAVEPEKPGLAVPTDPQIAGALARAKQVSVTPWTDATIAKQLIEKAPAAGRVVDRREIPAIGVTIVRFANGVEAWFKPTDFKNDQILFTMYSRGGTSLAEPAKYAEASLAGVYVNLSGAGGFKALDLQKMLAGQLGSASPFLSLSTHGISGSSTPSALETALQLLYLDFTAPGDDPDAFSLVKKQLQSAVVNRLRNPQAVFADRLEQVNTSNHYTAQPLTVERVETLDRAYMADFYRRRFSNAADFTFFIVGAFKTEEALPLVATYVGSLPSTGVRSAAWADVALRFPDKPATATVAMGSDPKSIAVISFFADPPPDEAEQERLDAADDVLEIALRDTLREELGETYTVSVGHDQALPQRGGGYVAVSFGAAPANVASMIDRVMQQVKRFQQEPPSDDLTNRAKQAAQRSYETALKQNGFWLSSLQSAHLFGQDPAQALERGRWIAAITPQILQQMFVKYFPADRHTVVTLTPAQ